MCFRFYQHTVDVSAHFIHVTFPHVKSLFNSMIFSGSIFGLFGNPIITVAVERLGVSELKTRAIVGSRGIVVTRDSFFAQRVIVRHVASP